MATTRIATIKNVVATGRRNKMYDGLMIWSAQPQPSSRWPTAGRPAAAAARSATEATRRATLSVPAAPATGEFLRLILVFRLGLGAGLGDLGRGRIRQLDLGTFPQPIPAI